MKALRGEGMSKRSDRIAKIKKGPGVFVYDGNAIDPEWIPTIKKVGRNQPVFGADGLPSVDSSGRQIYEPSGRNATDSNGRPVLGGIPKVKKNKVDALKVRGVSFPKGERVRVDDEHFALKLRSMACIKEVEDQQQPKKQNG